jgi:hypothetical protein
MVGPGALPLKPHKSNVRPGMTVCVTGSATKWKTFTPLSIVNGRSAIFGVKTGTGYPEFGGGIATGTVEGACWALAARASAAAPAPAPRMLRKKLLRGFMLIVSLLSLQ